MNDGDDLVGTDGDALVAPGPGYWDGFDTDLGAALGPRYRWNGLWRRDFSRGIVVVAEPGAATDVTTIDLERPHTDSFGTEASTFEVPAGTAVILRSS